MKFSFFLSCVAAYPGVGTVVEEAAVGLEHAITPLAHGGTTAHLSPIQIHHPPTLAEIHAPAHISEIHPASTRSGLNSPRTAVAEPETKGFPLEDPEFVKEQIRYQCGPTCLPMTAHGLTAGPRRLEVFFNFYVKGLKRKQLYFLVKDMRATIEAATGQIDRLIRIQGMLKDMGPRDPLIQFRGSNSAYMDEDIALWGIIKEDAKKYLDAANKASKDKSLFTPEFLKKIQAHTLTGAPLLRPSSLAYPLGEDIIVNMRIATAMTPILK